MEGVVEKGDLEVILGITRGKGINGSRAIGNGRRGGRGQEGII